MLLPTAPELAIGSSVLAAAALLGWYIWRRRQGSMVPAGYAARTPQLNIASTMPYAQTGQVMGNMGMMQEQGQYYQPETMNQGRVPETPLPQHMNQINQRMVPETPLPPQSLMNTTDTSLETIMRQAQMGLFALPNQEEYS